MGTGNGLGQCGVVLLKTSMKYLLPEARITLWLLYSLPFFVTILISDKMSSVLVDK